MKKWVNGFLSQLFGLNEARTADVFPTQNALKKAEKHKLTMDDLIDAFRYGEASKQDPCLLIRRFKNHQVCIRIMADEYRQNTFLIVTCWRIG